MTILTIMIWEYWGIKRTSIDSEFFKKIEPFPATIILIEVILTYTIAVRIDLAIINLIK